MKINSLGFVKVCCFSLIILILNILSNKAETNLIIGFVKMVID